MILKPPNVAGHRILGRAISALSNQWQRRNIWSAAAAMLVLVGVIGSIFAAWTVTQNETQRSREELATTSAEIASTLKLAIQHEQDLAVSVGAFFVEMPQASEAEFLQWTAAAQAFERYPELRSIGILEVIVPGQLSGFAARAETDPPGPLGASGTFQVIPAGNRPFYCLEPVSESRNPDSAVPAGVDYCDTVLGPGLLKARDSGQEAYEPNQDGKLTELGIGIPIYRAGAATRTVQDRRAAFLGWAGEQIVPSILLVTALEGHPNTAVEFHYGMGSSKVTFTAGSAPTGAKSKTINLHNGWRVVVLREGSGGGLLGDPYALAPLVGGILITLLLATLIFLLGNGRSRALVMVNERTDQLRHQALHDPLTGLPNRALILDRIDQMLARGRRAQTPVAALFLDLDNFKDINDTLGHAAGDQLLAAVGARLVNTLRAGDTVGRLGGDEFIVLVEGASLEAGADVVADRVLDVMDVPFEIPSSKVPLAVTTSIGVAVGDRVNAEELLHDADIALYRAKANGKQCFVLFSPSMQLAVDDHRHLELDLNQALEAKEFFLLYQPTVDLGTGAFTGVEALLRWEHPTRGVVQPDEFIPSLELSGLIIPVGRWVLEEACRQGSKWHRQGHRISVSVNISARQLERDNIVDHVHDALVNSGFDPFMLILELTETTLMKDVEATRIRLALLKALGVRLAIDDFGTGYSSLAYLRQFPVDVLKIDQSFVSGITDTVSARALVHTLVQLGKVLGLETIAEGVETIDQQMWLKDEEVDGGQGYLFAKPLPVASVNRLFMRSTKTAPGRTVEVLGPR